MGALDLGIQRRWFNFTTLRARGHLLLSTASDHPGKPLLVPALTSSQVRDLGCHGQINEALGVAPNQAVQPTGWVVDLLAGYCQVTSKLVQKRLPQFTGSLSHSGQHPRTKRGIQPTRQNEFRCLLAD